MTPTRKPSWIWRLLKGGWDALNFGRRLILNLVFVLVLLLFFGMAMHRAPPLQSDTTLVIAPEAVVVEQFSSDPVERALERMTGDGVPEVQLRDLLRVIEHAQDDPRINRILIRPDSFYGAGFAALREIGQALRSFRAAGKEVVAYADFMEQRQYYLAAMADEVYLNPEGAFLLEGLSRYRAYYREAIEDKLGANVHLFRAGEYKSYGEPFTRDSASPEALEADLFWMGDVWQRFLGELAEARGLDAAAMQSMIDGSAALLIEAGGDMAKLAQNQGYVDELLAPDQIEARLIERGAADEGELRSVGIDQYLAVIQAERAGRDAQAPVAIIVAEGEVLDGEQPPGTIGGRSTAALIRAAREDEAVKAMVVRVNSPGGSAFASEEIRRELQITREAGKPVVVSMGDVAASGGYWISLGADTVVADPSTITGSIGVVGMFLTFPQTLEKIGIRVDGAATTRLAGAFDPRRALQPEVGQIIQSTIDKIYRDFIARTAEVRERSEEEIDAVARGRVWSGAQAFERGLIDELGGLTMALQRARELAKLDADARVRYIEPELSPWEQFVAGLGEQARLGATMRALGINPALLDPATRRELAWTHWLQAGQRLPFRSLAHCFCAL